MLRSLKFNGLGSFGLARLRPRLGDPGPGRRQLLRHGERRRRDWLDPKGLFEPRHLDGNSLSEKSQRKSIY